MPKGVTELGDERMVTVWSNREQTVVYITLCSEDDCVMVSPPDYPLEENSGFETTVCYKRQEYVGRTSRLWEGFRINKRILCHPSSCSSRREHLQPRGTCSTSSKTVDKPYSSFQANGDGKITAYHGGPYDVKSILGYAPEDDVLTFNSAGGGIGTMKLYRVNKATTDKVS